MVILETKNLSKYYGKARGIIDISIEINKSEIFGFIGPNGAGKSTTIRTLLGFLKPSGGTASIFGRDCFRYNAELRANIGYVPAEVNYYDDMRVKDILYYSAQFYKKDCTKRINELCSLFEVQTNKKFDSLSFGNKKKVAIVQALLHQPELLILDEPTSGLDPLMQSTFFDVLKDEQKRGATILLSSHILGEVERMCDRVAIIKEGRILKTESIEDIRSNKYKKLKLEHSEGDSFDCISLPGIASMNTNGRITEFMYSGDINSLISMLSSRKLENLWIEEPSLEEIFMHYYEKEEK